MSRLSVLALFALGCTPFDAPDPLEGIQKSTSVRNTLGEPNTITPVLFLPRDQPMESGDLETLNLGLADIEWWYSRELNGGRLRMTDIAIVHGELTAEEYIEEDRIWSVGHEEVAAALGVTTWPQDQVLLVIGKGLRGWAGGAGTPTTGYAAVGLDSLTRPETCSEKWWCTPEMWRGTVIHELGHALTLPHSEPHSIMNFHGDYLEKHLINTDEYPEKDTVRNSRFTDEQDLNTRAVCEAESCPVFQLYDVNDDVSFLENVPRGTQVGIIGEAGGWQISSYAMLDRWNKIQVISGEQGWRIERQEVARTMRCDNIDGCNMYVGIDPEYPDRLRTMGPAPFGTRQVVMATDEGFHIVSAPIPDRGNAVHMLSADEGWTDVTGRVLTEGTALALDHARFRFVGVNQTGLAHYGFGEVFSDSDTEDVATQLDAAQAAGATVIRITIGNEFIGDEETAERLSMLLDKVERRDLRLIVTFMDTYRTPMRPSDIDPYYDLTDSHGFARLNSDYLEENWHDNAHLRLNAFIETVVTRNAGRKGVMAWELGNGLVNNGSYSGMLAGWAERQARWIKSMDPGALVTVGVSSTEHAFPTTEEVSTLVSPGAVDFLTAHSFEAGGGEVNVEIGDGYGVPFIVESAGFHHSGDRVTRLRMAFDDWYARGADGILLSSLNGVPHGNGDDDVVHGVIRNTHEDYDDMVHALNEVSATWSLP